jgi:hypothetical protein
MLGINFAASMINEYVRQANFNQISPRSFKHNLQEGWTWDDNEFKTNQLLHPFSGSTYFNAARANGLGFWRSAVMSNVGAFVWERCGETHPMSWNDMISTGIGGVARGESTGVLPSSAWSCSRGHGSSGRGSRSRRTPLRSWSCRRPHRHGLRPGGRRRTDHAMLPSCRNKEEATCQERAAAPSRERSHSSVVPSRPSGRPSAALLRSCNREMERDRRTPPPGGVASLGSRRRDALRSSSTVSTWDASAG